MKGKSKIVVLCLAIVFNCCFIPKKGFAQQYNFKNYSVENGLPYVIIYTLFQDQSGYLWSGGYGGASKFNGKKFQHFSPKNGLSNHYVNSITQNQNSEIIIGTIDGLSVIDYKSSKVKKIFNVKNGLPSNKVNSVCFDFKQKTWIGTNTGLCYLENNKLFIYDKLKDVTITCLLNSVNYGLWVGTTKGLFNIHNNKLTHYSINEGLCSDAVNCISFNTLTNEVLIGTQNGLSILNLPSNKIFNYHVSNGLLDEVVNTVTCSENGVEWIGFKNGLISFDGKEFSYYNIKDDNNSNNIISLLIDYEKNLWIGTHNGIFKFRGKGFASYSKNDGIGSSFVYQIFKDKSGSLWITTENNGVFKFENGYFKKYTYKDGLLDNNSKCVLQTDDGTLWFGTSAGISKFKNEKFSNLSFGDLFKLQGPINCLFKDNSKNIWVGGKNGVCCFKKVNDTYLPIYFKLPTNVSEYNVWSINQDLNGSIWVGTYLAGLFKLEGNQFVNMSSITAQPLENVLEIEFDSLNNLYGATLNGVLVYNLKSKHTSFIAEKDGLNSELVYAIKLSNSKKYLWAGTNQGINKINIQKINENVFDILSYSKADGFEGVECNSHGIYEDDLSNVWFGTVNGLMKYTPSEIKFNDNPSRTTISTIKLGFLDTLLANNSILDYNNNNISFEFDGISLTNPEKVLYTYKLEGYDKSWSPNSIQNFVRYDNLPNGTFVFKVKSCNSEGIWNIEATSFTFTIKQAYYKSWWFILLWVVILAAIVILIFRIRLAQIKRKQQIEFENKVEISKSELKALRAQMNPHFVFNSLNSIQHYILNSKGEEAVRYLSKFAKLIRIILSNSEKATVTINEDVESIILYLELEKMRFDNKFNYSITIHPGVNADYDEIPPMLIQPYLENAILHGINPKEGNGFIDIDISIVGQFIKLTVKDDGIGREKAQSLQSLQPSARHKSLGMKITKERVRILNTLHQSNLNVTVTDLYDSENKPSGTQVDLFIPYMN